MLVEELAAKLSLDLDEAGWSRAEQVLHSLHHGLAAFAGAAVAALAAGAAGLAKMTADAAVSASRLAQSTGVDLKTLQEFGFAASASGVSMEQMAVAMRHLAKTGVKDVGAGMLELAERFSKMPDSGEKVRIAMEKLGRGSGPLIAFLNRGRDAIAEMAEEANILGVVLTEDDVKAGEDFKRQLHLLEAGFQGIGYSIGRLVLPAFKSLIRAFASLILFLRKNPEVAKKLLIVLGSLGVVLGIITTALIANAVATYAAAAAHTFLGWAAFKAGAKALLSWTAAAAPVVILTTLLVAAALVAEDVYGFLKGDDSLIGEIGPKWTKWLDDFTKPLPSDPAWLVALKVALRVLTDIQGTWRALTGQMEKSEFFEKVLGLQARGPISSTSRPDSGFIGNLLDKFGATPSFGGGAASPQAAVGFRPNASGAFQLQTNINVTANNVAADPQILTGKIVAAVNEAHERNMRAALAGRGR